MDNQKIAIIAGTIVLLAGGGLFWNYTETIRMKNEIERERIESSERIKNAELEQKQAIEQAKLDRELELDCQKRITVMKGRFYNVQNGYFDTDSRLCMVSYKDTTTKELEWSDIDLMQAN